MTATGRITTASLTQGTLLVTDERSMPTTRKTGTLRRIDSVTSELRVEGRRKAARVYTVMFTDGTFAPATSQQTWTLAKDGAVAHDETAITADDLALTEAVNAEVRKPRAAKKPPAKAAKQTVTRTTAGNVVAIQTRKAAKAAAKKATPAKAVSTTDRAVKAAATHAEALASGEVRTCNTCNQAKPITAFPTAGHGKDGAIKRGPKCRACRDAK